MAKLLILLIFLILPRALFGAQEELDRNQFEILGFKAPYLILWEKFASQSEDNTQLCTFEEAEYPGRRIHVHKISKESQFELLKSFDLRSDRVQNDKCDSKENIQTRLDLFRKELSSLGFSKDEISEYTDSVLILGSEEINPESGLAKKELQFNLPYLSSLSCQGLAHKKCEGKQWIHHQNFDYFLDFKAKTTTKKTEAHFSVRYDFKRKDRQPKTKNSPKKSAKKPLKKHPKKAKAESVDLDFSFKVSNESRHGMELSPVLLYIYDQHIVFFTRIREESFGDRQMERPKVFALKVP